MILFGLLNSTSESELSLRRQAPRDDGPTTLAVASFGCWVDAVGGEKTNCSDALKNRLFFFATPGVPCIEISSRVFWVCEKSVRFLFPAPSVVWSEIEAKLPMESRSEAAMLPMLSRRRSSAAAAATSSASTAAKNWNKNGYKQPVLPESLSKK